LGLPKHEEKTGAATPSKAFFEESFGKFCQKSKVFELGSPVLKSG
jgi:hypothetical protein